jgi:hypothetical protein
MKRLLGYMTPCDVFCSSSRLAHSGFVFRMLNPHVFISAPRATLVRLLAFMPLMAHPSIRIPLTFQIPTESIALHFVLKTRMHPATRTLFPTVAALGSSRLCHYFFGSWGG